MSQENKNYIQVSVRVYKDESPDTFHLLSQIKRSRSTLIRRICDITVKRDSLRNVNPINIINGTYLIENHGFRIVNSSSTETEHTVVSQNSGNNDEDNLNSDLLYNSIQLDFED